MRDPEDKEHWIPDPDAAPVVKRIFALTIDGKGLIRSRGCWKPNRC
jgi:hypothetical protein